MVRSDLFWTGEEEDGPLNAFLSAKKASMIQDDGTKPWIWVQKEETESRTNTEEDVENDTLERASAILASVTDRVKEIESDPNIPTRANKAKCTRSKKDLREEAQADAAASLKALSIESGETCGKWLLFRDGTRVDPTFATLARSLVHGPLSKTAVFRMKVATCPPGDEEHYQHVICLYYPNVYDEEASKEILRVAAEEHGIELSSVKADLWTKIGLDSKHESKMRSTIWQPKELGFDKERMKATIDAYWEKQKNAKATEADEHADAGDGSAKKRKPTGSTEQEVKKSTAKRAKATFAADDSASSSDEEKKPVTTAKKAVPPPVKSATKSRAKKTFTDGDDSSDEEEDMKPSVRPASMSKTLAGKPASTKSAAGSGQEEVKVEAQDVKAEQSGSETEPE